MIDPQGQQKPNAIVLHGLNGTSAPSKPRSVTIAVNRAAKVIHLLSGVGGYCHPVVPDQLVVMLVRVKYTDGETEEHRYINGVHFADYIQRVEVPGSSYAFDLNGKQLRYLWLIPKKAKVIESIELAKEADNTFAPIIMAITTQQADGPSESGETKHFRSTDVAEQPIPVTKDVATENEWRAALEQTLKDPTLLVSYTFDEASVKGNTIANRAPAMPGQFDLKLMGPQLTAGRYPGKKSLRFIPNGSSQRAEISEQDSRQLQLSGDFTVAVWFKIGTFDREWQTLMGNGDRGWRIHRDRKSVV